ncbi:MAG: TIM barrel protein [Ignavibacteriaceae bacterium]|nr:TIM barrel protein [Ignavibacteriaceae bacterium]
MIFISSVAVKNPSLNLLNDISKKYRINFELSANIIDEDNIDIKLCEFSSDFLIHNYFPKPIDDFVINLASSNEIIRKKSIEFACGNIFRCEKYKIPIYSIHSGFRFDPIPKYLGVTFDNVELNDYSSSFDLFIKSIREILNTTLSSSVSLLLENNVITKNNLNSFRQNPLLCCDTNDYIKLFSIVKDSRLGILADYGHLKVSANTLKFTTESFYETLKNRIYAHHLSFNNGLYDSNKPFKTSNIFDEIKYISNSDYFTLEINNLDIEDMLKQKELLQKYLNKKNEDKY